MQARLAGQERRRVSRFDRRMANPARLPLPIVARKLSRRDGVRSWVPILVTCILDHVRLASDTFHGNFEPV